MAAKLATGAIVQTFIGRLAFVMEDEVEGEPLKCGYFGALPDTWETFELDRHLVKQVGVDASGIIRRPAKEEVDPRGVSIEEPAPRMHFLATVIDDHYYLLAKDGRWKADPYDDSLVQLPTDRAIQKAAEMSSEAEGRNVWTKSVDEARKEFDEAVAAHDARDVAP